MVLSNFFTNQIGCLMGSHIIKRKKEMQSIKYSQRSTIGVSQNQRTIFGSFYGFQSEPLHEKDLFAEMTPNHLAGISSNQRNQMMIKMACMVNSNTLQIFNINQKLLQSQKNVAVLAKNIGQISLQSHQKRVASKLTMDNTDDESAQKNLTLRASPDPFTQKIFGNKLYRYQLQLDEELPEVFYKEKNFDLRVKLVNMENGKVMNSNVVNLCFGVCNIAGEWITQNRFGEALMKGQTEVELYHGEADFRKLYSREVSRKFEGGRVNFVIYAKPSVLRFSHSSSFQARVLCEQIEPLILKNVCVMSKRF